jgi:hypothetical protein
LSTRGCEIFSDRDTPCPSSTAAFAGARGPLVARSLAEIGQTDSILCQSLSVRSSGIIFLIFGKRCIRWSASDASRTVGIQQHLPPERRVLVRWHERFVFSRHRGRLGCAIRRTPRGQPPLSDLDTQASEHPGQEHRLLARGVLLRVVSSSGQYAGLKYVAGGCFPSALFWQSWCLASMPGPTLYSPTLIKTFSEIMLACVTGIACWSANRKAKTLASNEIDEYSS